MVLIMNKEQTINLGPNKKQESKDNVYCFPVFLQAVFFKMRIYKTRRLALFQNRFNLCPIIFGLSFTGVIIPERIRGCFSFGFDGGTRESEVS